MPTFAADEFMDFLVTEAVVVRARNAQSEAEEQAAKKREEDAWKKRAAQELPG